MNKLSMQLFHFLFRLKLLAVLTRISCTKSLFSLWGKTLMGAICTSIDTHGKIDPRSPTLNWFREGVHGKVF